MAQLYVMRNATAFVVPELPAYTLEPRPSLIPGISDGFVQALSPVVAYWVVSLFFHLLDVYDLCAQYRLHTPAEVLKRNHVTRYEVLRDVILQQIVQTIFSLTLAYYEPSELMGKEEYDIAVWAQRLRVAESYVPSLLAVAGLNSSKLALRMQKSYPMLSSILAGGSYPQSGFALWEMNVAKLIFHIVIPFIQFTAAICFLDTWQYFLHRAMHNNRYLYNTFHIRHHRLYVPYAYGALYNHPVEGFVLDTLGGGLSYLLTGMTTRQGMIFYACSTIKTVDDHCGYAFPWDPLQHITSNNAAYHDIHHQSWGIKSNFSQPFFTCWDRWLGTTWKGGDVSLRYERDRIAAQKKLDATKDKLASSVTNSPAINREQAQRQAAESQKQVLETDGPVVLKEEQNEEQEVRRVLKKSSRRRTGSFDPRSTFSERVPSLHGSRTPILHADGMH